MSVWALVSPEDVFEDELSDDDASEDVSDGVSDVASGDASDEVALSASGDDCASATAIGNNVQLKTADNTSRLHTRALERIMTHTFNAIQRQADIAATE